MIKKIFLQLPDTTIIDFINGKTAKLTALSQRDLQNIYEDTLKGVRILHELIDEKLVWGERGPAIRILEITNVFHDENNYCLEIDGADREIIISPEELKTLLFGLVEK